MSFVEKISVGYNDIPDVPEIMFKILSIIKDEKTGLNDIADVMCYEKPIADFVLKYVNSKYCAIDEVVTIKSLPRALAKLGTEQARNIVLTFIIRPILMSYDKEFLWIHSLKTAIGCRKFAAGFNIMNPEDAYLLGLLHDAGKLVLKDKSPKAYDEVLYRVHTGDNIFDAENEFFGTNHCDVGFLIAKKWQFPQEVIDGIKYHHFPEKSGDLMTAYLVSIADDFAQDDFDIAKFDESKLSKLNVSIPDVEKFKQDIDTEVEVLMGLF